MIYEKRLCCWVCLDVFLVLFKHCKQKSHLVPFFQSRQTPLKPTSLRTSHQKHLWLWGTFHQQSVAVPKSAEHWIIRLIHWLRCVSHVLLKVKAFLKRFPTFVFLLKCIWSCFLVNLLTFFFSRGKTACTLGYIRGLLCDIGILPDLYYKKKVRYATHSAVTLILHPVYFLYIYVKLGSIQTNSFSFFLAG